jgi:hypothetical protein
MEINRWSSESRRRMLSIAGRRNAESELCRDLRIGRSTKIQLTSRRPPEHGRPRPLLIYRMTYHSMVITMIYLRAGRTR